MDDQIAQIPKALPPAYTIYGDHLNGKLPLVVLHGGPSTGSGYLYPFAELWLRHQIPIVFYDQIGCGRSTRLPETLGDHDFWQESTYIAELNNFLDHLKLHDGPGFYLLGHSWGGMLAAAFATSRPRGLRRLVLPSASASTELSELGHEYNIVKLPANHRDAIGQARLTEDFESPAFRAAEQAYTMKFIAGMATLPKVMLDAMVEIEADPTPRVTWQGTSKHPFKRNGSCVGWTSVQRLHRINVPTLVYNAEDDVCHESAAQPFVDRIPKMRQVFFQDASHMIHLQDNGRREKVIELVGEFLTAGRDTGVTVRG
ncbi:hypothetical protein ANO11243_091140 [Dothideomycetidae sp. 11243]|nr:hypothetical protein ANO11243_091140 [fungal sp. No.11243]